jgi:hypothetical protein
MTTPPHHAYHLPIKSGRSQKRYLEPINTQVELRAAIRDALLDQQTSECRVCYENMPRVLYGLQLIGASLKAEQTPRPSGRPKGTKNDATKRPRNTRR